MAVESEMVPLGTALPHFALPDLEGRTVDSSEFAGQTLLVAFVCNHCPYVKHVEAGLAAVVADSPGLAVVAICANDTDAYPDDDLPGMRDQATRAGWDFPYLLDRSQQVARAFGAACTPDFFLYDAAGSLAYRGAMDASTPGNGLPVTGEELRSAITRVLAGQPVPEPHRPSMGCSLKWRP
ncbi:thioredoxin family protein [Nocardioides limicola]|uniref:thioredoxin family protein n=1 Tax=Nocardioides limicola TaxID=2803368 RepID=UPI00193C1AC3|nr:thioredoxin family protein [Nocardioides sp. DJM-14]